MTAATRRDQHPDRGRDPGPGLSVLVVDALPVARHGLRALVDGDPGLRWLGSSGNVRAMSTAVARLCPDVLVLDSMLDPELERVRAIAAAHRRLAIVLLVADGDRTSGFVRGAQALRIHGLIPRAAPPADIRAAVHAAGSGRVYVHPQLVEPVAPEQRYYGRVASGPRHEPGKILSARQLEVLELIAEGMGTDAIAQSLFVSRETVRTHVKEILRRLGARDRAHAIVRAYRLGVLSALTEV